MNQWQYIAFRSGKCLTAKKLIKIVRGQMSTAKSNAESANSTSKKATRILPLTGKPFSMLSAPTTEESPGFDVAVVVVGLIATISLNYRKLS